MASSRSMNIIVDKYDKIYTQGVSNIDTLQDERAYLTTRNLPDLQLCLILKGLNQGMYFGGNSSWAATWRTCRRASWHAANGRKLEIRKLIDWLILPAKQERLFDQTKLASLAAIQ